MPLGVLRFQQGWVLNSVLLRVHTELHPYYPVLTDVKSPGTKERGRVCARTRDITPATCGSDTVLTLTHCDRLQGRFWQRRW